MKASMWGIFALSLCAAAHAAGDGARQTRVDVSDLDLSHSQGVDVAYRRIKLAAVKVCEQPYGSSLAEIPQVRSCQAKAIEDAVSRIHNPMLSEYHESQKQHRAQRAS